MTKYEFIYNEMLKRLQSGHYKIGDKFMTETEAAAEFSVTHMTVRQAFRLLVENGFVKRMRKKGTFVISLSGNTATVPGGEGDSRSWCLYVHNSTQVDQLGSLLKPFRDTHPHLDLSLHEKPQSSAGSMFQYLEIAAEKILLVEFNDVLRYRAAGQPQPLSFLLHQSIVDLDQEKILRYPLSAVGPVLAVPIRYVNRLPIVNLTLAETLGLDTNKLPTLWREVEDWCRTAKAGGCRSPLLPVPGSLFASYTFHCYLANALQSETGAAEKTLMLKEPFLETVIFFRNLYKHYSVAPSERSNIKSVRDNMLFNLFTGPWFFYENRINKVASRFAALDQFVPENGASNFMYSAPSYLGLFSSPSSLSQQEKDDLNDFFEFACSRDFHEKILHSNKKGYPCQTPNREAQYKQVADSPDLQSFYRNNFVPLQRHNIPCFETWHKIVPELESFFNDNMDPKELWEKVDWIQNRPETKMDSLF